MPFTFGVFVDVFLRETAEEDAVETGMESVQVGTAHVADTRLCLQRVTGRGREEVNKRLHK